MKRPPVTQFMNRIMTIDPNVKKPNRVSMKNNLYQRTRILITRSVVNTTERGALRCLFILKYGKKLRSFSITRSFPKGLAAI
ncbi:hypothetical protein ACJROX_26250 [Pseudalkalibacillus sp. A8]|uniref:hypothetical protein n=1 Tax=Pseudalkalibacillus sp. A8 TaxID=3382641 RepID=UPI0038B4F293